MGKVRCPDWNASSFTLIELVIVVAILAILAAVAIPVFGNLQKQARDSATQGALGAMRQAIQIYRANEIVSDRQPGTPGVWPDNGCPDQELLGVEQRPSGPWVMESGIVPDNPWKAGKFMLPEWKNYVEVYTTAPPPKGTLSLSLVGWLYARVTCDVWANSAANGGPITENNF